VIPSGAIEVCGSSPTRRATSLVLKEWMSAPSRTTWPADGLNRRDSPRSRVDLPHAFGPTMTVNDSSGIATDSSWEMTRLS
jgi:hypothetical protein